MARISQTAAQRISKAVTNIERISLTTRAQDAQTPQTNYGSYVVKVPSGGMSARSGVTLGTADCVIQVIDKTTREMSDGETVTVLNLTEESIAADSYQLVTRTKTGDYIVGGGGAGTSNNGVVRGTSEENFDDNTPSVDVTVTFSNLEDISIGQTVTATNYIGYSGDLGGECYVYYHGDGTGNEDGTFDLMGARCPV